MANGSVSICVSAKAVVGKIVMKKSAVMICSIFKYCLEDWMDLTVYDASRRILFQPKRNQ